MSIQVAMGVLIYFIVLILAYVIIIFTNEDAEKSSKIINKAFQIAYSVLFFGFLVIYTLIIIPHITLEFQTTTYLILTSKFISVLSLGVSLAVLNRKSCND